MLFTWRSITKFVKSLLTSSIIDIQPLERFATYDSDQVVLKMKLAIAGFQEVAKALSEAPPCNVSVVDGDGFLRNLDVCIPGEYIPSFRFMENAGSFDDTLSVSKGTLQKAMDPQRLYNVQVFNAG